MYCELNEVFWTCVLLLQLLLQVNAGVVLTVTV